MWSFSYVATKKFKKYEAPRVGIEGVVAVFNLGIKVQPASSTHYNKMELIPAPDDTIIQTVVCFIQSFSGKIWNST